MLLSGCGLISRSFFRSTPETNYVFRLDRNQVVLPTARVEGNGGRFVASTATRTTLLGNHFVASHHLHRLRKPFRVTLGTSHTATVSPNVVDLGDSIDGLVGSDVLGPVVSFDYRRGLVTVSPVDEMLSKDMQIVRFRELPAVPVGVGAATVVAIVDTAFPDTLVIPVGMLHGVPRGRIEVPVTLAGHSWSHIDVLIADVSEPRIGNRLLSQFLITVDYPNRKIGLWPYPSEPEDATTPAP